jgi:hypothetical protein
MYIRNLLQVHTRLLVQFKVMLVRIGYGGEMNAYQCESGSKGLSLKFRKSYRIYDQSDN